MRREGKSYVNGNLKRISRVIKKANKRCMNNYYSSNLNQFQQDPKFLNEHLGRQMNKEIKIYDENGYQITNNQKCNMFNEFFIQILKTLRAQIECLPGDTCNNLRTLSRCEPDFQFCHTTNF